MGKIVIYASTQLVHTLLEQDLIDEVRLMIHPIVLGAGQRLFVGNSGKLPLRPAQVLRVGDSLVFLTYNFPTDTISR